MMNCRVRLREIMLLSFMYRHTRYHGYRHSYSVDPATVELADNPPPYIPSSAAPDHPDSPLSLAPPPPPRTISASGGFPAASPHNSAIGDQSGTRGTGGISSRLSRRRRRSITPTSRGLTSEGTGGLAGGTASDTGHQETEHHTSSVGYTPSPKRRRLANMRPDGISSTNGSSHTLNGSPASPSQKAAFPLALNGQASHTTSNGDLHTNGSQKSKLNSSTYFGHDREEVTRILIQSLYELGYDGAASLLSKESGYQLESPAVATFRNAVLEGRWAEAEHILVQSFNYDRDEGRGGGHGEQLANKERLVLVKHAEKNEMLFHLRQQKFLELLEARDLGAALMVLRQELTPLNYDIGRLHALSSLLMCPPEHLHDQAGWDGPISSSRERLLSELSKSISPSVMIPDNRLAILLDHVKQNQINQCLYHNTANPPSLYSDHMCDRKDFPLRTEIQLNEHRDEVWWCSFSHDGTRLVTACKDSTVIIYDTNTFTVLHTLREHTDGVVHCEFSPDDSKLITCSQDKTARVWNVETGRCLLTINHHRQPVTSAAWAPDGETFVTASLDLSSQLCHWSMRGGQVLHTWHGGFRVQDCTMTPDGRRLVAADLEGKLHVYNFATRDEEYCLTTKSRPTSVAVSKDSRYLLVNLADNQLQLIDLNTTDVVRRFQGQKQGNFVIRSVFGGAADNFIVSGSEDSRIYIWHKENGTLVEVLEAHTRGCVNSLSWNPSNPGMFASAGDDCMVRIWTRERDTRSSAAAGKRRAVSGNGFARTSSLRSTSRF
ncbi:WD domain protein [Aspergillus saccharolyticus JOP 1030-1]|uniref:WD domain protein n=1 Tax=Aspergillus saccharolyticus JOP 1030-1 TaxID=1450539 RepID=A0A319A1Y4_9EURO|nr:WD domain protein [Aspergillus saccharolyticus JOP 1030-1]PYH46288.1 WD domain protein [Aspergillus saccharolyticus JOP 1030-1]